MSSSEITQAGVTQQTPNGDDNPRVKGVPLAERETTINIVGDGSEVMIWTNIPKHIRALRKKAPKVREIDAGYHGTTEWADFRIDEKDFNPARGVRSTVNLTAEQRQAAAERFRKARAEARP